MIHRWLTTLDLDDMREVGTCTCGWESLPRWREDAGRHAVGRHAERQAIFDAVGRVAQRAKKFGAFYQDVTA